MAEHNRREAYTGDTIVVPRTKRRNAATEPPSRPRRQARRRIWPRVRNTLIAITLLLLVALVVLYLQINSLSQAIVVADARGNPSLASPLFGGVNLLLIGVDERDNAPEEGVRSDTLILAHLDGGGRWANMLSIPRDTQVELRDIGITKINVAYGQGYANSETLYGAGTTPQQGGMALAAQTVDTFLDLNAHGARIDYTAQINFNGFAALIDTLGGITVDVPEAIVDDEYPTPDFGTIRIEFQSGVQRMNGERALIYARTRHSSSDFDRSTRQQQVIRAIATEFRSRGLVGRITATPAVLKSLQGTLTTTMPISRPDVLLGMLMLAGGVDPSNIGQYNLNPNSVGVTETGGGNLVWDTDGVRTQVNQLLARADEKTEDALVQVLNGTSKSGLGGSITGKLEDAGFRVTVAGNAQPPDGNQFPKTTVYNLRNKPNTASRIARTLNADVSTGPLPDGASSDADIVVLLGENAAN